MARLILVRHGEAAAGWGDAADPGLSETGRRQADDVATALAPIGPQPILVSPLRRTLETAVPLAQRWDVEPTVEPRVGEIRTPPDLTDRSSWLAGVMAGRWTDQDEPLQTWAEQLVEVLTTLQQDTVVVSHFVAINVAIGRATDDDRVVCARLGNCSRTVLDNADGRLRIVEPPVEVPTTDVL